MPDFDFDQTIDSTPRAAVAFADLSTRDKARVLLMVRRMCRCQREGRATTVADLVGFTQHELMRLAPIARQRMNSITFRQDNFEAALAEQVERETLGGDMPDDRAVDIAVAAASGLVPSDAQIATHLIGIGIPASVLARTWGQIKSRLGAHTAKATHMPEVA